MKDPVARLRAALAGHYAIERELGHGGMATVYLAQDLKHHRQVAVKVLRPEISASVGTERFLREIEIAAHLNHPHILPLHDSGEADGVLYFVMPYVEGETLRERLEREKQLPIEEALKIAGEVADALSYAHSHDVVHRDIKPGNILFSGGHAVVADFGIARAISAAGRKRLTGTGFAIGTTEYMSPEQCAGQAELDGRSDLYSLGCVLYEMLIGEPPFTGPDPHTVGARHLQEPPRPLRPVRSSIPREVDALVTKLLAKVPADRFKTATHVLEALGAVASPDVSAERRRLRRQRWWTTAGAAAVLGVALVLTVPRLFEGATLDPSQYLILAFQPGEGGEPELLKGGHCERLLRESFTRWQDVRPVDWLHLKDALLRRGDSPLTLRDARALAVELQARWIVWGDLMKSGDSASVRAVLYDARGTRLSAVREYRIALGPDDLRKANGVLRHRFDELADSLLVGRASTRIAAAGAMGTDLIEAWREYDRGHDALGDFELSAAREGFARAAELDPGYAQAHFWLAQVQALAGMRPEAWRGAAGRAVALADQLGAEDRARAEALYAMTEERFQEACEIYQRLVAEHPSDVLAWYGLGDCHGRDRLVVRNAGSPSGWAFRGSYHRAVRAYRRALELAPSLHLAFRGLDFTRLPRLLFAEANDWRGGYAVDGDTIRFLAFPSLVGDSLAFVPYPARDVTAGTAGTDPPTHAEAVVRNRETLLEIARAWAEALPTTATAYEVLALALETGGQLEGALPDRSALAAIRGARALASDSSEALRLAAAETRILLKLEAFVAAARLADSVLPRWVVAHDEDAVLLAGLATLLGQPGRAASLAAGAVGVVPQHVPGPRHRRAQVLALQTPWNEDVSVPPAIAEAALRILVYASLGAPQDSLTAYERRIAELVRTNVVQPEQERVRIAAMHIPVSLAYPALEVEDIPEHEMGGNYLLRVQLALARGDTLAGRAALDAVFAARAGHGRPGDVALDGTYLEALVLLALGDSAAATQHLDGMLEALATTGTGLLSTDPVGSIPQAASLVRAMALRAELAAAGGDSASVRRWAPSVVSLWSGGEPAVQPVVTRMRQIFPAPGGRR